MLAVDYDLAKLVYPVWASPKLDGIRGLVHDSALLSRSLKHIPNKHVQNALASPYLIGIDGELIAGSAMDPNCMQACTSFFMSRDKVSDDWRFHVFDLHSSDLGYEERYKRLVSQVECYGHPNIVIHSRRFIQNEDELLEYEAECLAKGYEGLILRKPTGLYKFGRSTVNDGLLLKVKRFTDSEATIIGFEEQMENTNEKQTNELGRSKRSSHQAGLVAKGTLGALVVRDISTGVEFNIGTGMDDARRARIWSSRQHHLGLVVKYKSFLVGVKDAPRHPVFLSFRDAMDMS